MKNEERSFAKEIIAESRTTLAVQALQESNESLQEEIEYLREENARLRNTNRVLRTVNHQVRGKTTDLLGQVEEMGQHIFDIASQEDSDSTQTT